MRKHKAVLALPLPLACQVRSLSQGQLVPTGHSGSERVLVNGVAIKTTCAAGLTSVTTEATSAASCVTLAGYGYATATSRALACPVGIYSAGPNQGVRLYCGAHPVRLLAP